MEGFHSATDRYLRSRALPEGHVERTAAEKKYRASLDAEYGASRIQESRWLRNSFWRRHQFLVSYSQSANISQILCDSLRVKPLKNLWFESDEVKDTTIAHYNSTARAIHFKWRLTATQVVTLVHELAHHVCYMEKLPLNHGHDFLWVEKMLFECLDCHTDLVERI